VNWIWIKGIPNLTGAWMNILFVCSGNVSRSFLAEALLRHEVEVKGLENISIASTGLYVFAGSPPDPKMVEYLHTMGISAEEHAARQITKGDVGWADLILVMEKDHLARIERLWPEVRGKAELLGTFISDGHIVDDIVDPFGKSSYHYRLAQAQITYAIKSFVEKTLIKKKNGYGSQNEHNAS
jgi:protein-tyrosine phosphatase